MFSIILLRWSVALDVFSEILLLDENIFFLQQKN